MSTVAARLWGQIIVEVFEHTSVTGETWKRIKSGTTTGNGAADGTTIVDTDGDSGAADTYNGLYWVRIKSGTYKGLRRRIVDDDGSGTLTLEGTGFPGQIVSGVEYEILLSPDAIVVCDGDTLSTTQFNMDARDEDDDTWKDYLAIPITGNLVGEVSKVTAFDKTGGASEGLFTVSPAFSQAPAQGDVIKLRKIVEVSADDLSISPAQASHPRPQTRVNHSRGQWTPGAHSGSVKLTVEAQASGSLASAGSKASSTPLGTLLKGACLEETIGTSCQVGAGSSTSAVKIATGSWENLAVGMMVIYNGEAAFITSLEDGGVGVDTVNVAPPFSVAPTSGETLYATRMYAKSEGDGGYGIGLDIEIDGVRHLLTGCKGTVSEGGDDVRRLTFDLQVDEWHREVEAAAYRPNSYYSTVEPVRADELIAYLGTSSRTADRVSINGLTSTPGTQVAAKGVQGDSGLNGRSGFHLTGYDAGATFRELLLSDGDLPADLRFLAQTSKDFVAIFGSHGNTFAVRIPAARLREIATPESLDGLAAAPNVLGDTDAGTSTDGDGTVQKVPDFAYHIA